MDGFDLTDAQRAQLHEFVGMVRSSPHNLVSPRAREELWTRHVPECLALARLLVHRPGPLLDVGSGGGFPGIVLAIAQPDRETHLLDATAKKCRFLKNVSDELGLGVTVHTARAEEVSRGTLAGRFATVTARAVAPLERLVPLSAPFLADDGVLVALKGERWRPELDRASGQLRSLRLMALATPNTLEVAAVEGQALRVVMIGRRGTPLLLQAPPPAAPTT